jgi:hypothetical protein
LRQAVQELQIGGTRVTMRIEPVFLFDLDGTLIDSVYQHVLAWKQAQLHSPTDFSHIILMINDILV